MNNVCLFCGANAGHDANYRQVAEELARELVANKYGLIYGGGCVGLMGAVANAALQSGGHVVGVVPQFLKDHEVAHAGLQELIVTESMHERKSIMAARSDAVLVLPGGFGTLDEFFEILTWKQLHLHSKPIVILNVNGFFDHLAKWIEHMVAEGFLKPSNAGLLQIAVDVDQVLDLLRNYQPPPRDGAWIAQQLV